MNAWDSATLTAIAAKDDLHIAPLRDDGLTIGTPTWIWPVVVDGRLFVRAWNGTRSRWYRAAMTQGAGRITAAGATHDVEFLRAPHELATEIDAAYRSKYIGSPYLPPMVSAGPRAATAEIRPTA